MQISETNISYNNTAVLIGGSSHYEITYEKRDYEGINKIEKIEDVPNIKIVFNQLTLALLNWLKASERNTVSIGTGLVRFWNKTGEANGIYQVHFTCDEFKQTVTLYLYQKSPESKTGSINIGSLLELGTVLLHPFGRGNFKVGGVTVPIVRSLAEKNISTDIQKYKFADGWQYFITDKTTFNIKIYDLTTGSSPLISQLDAIKNQMVKFVPHAENPAVEYLNAYLDYDKKEVDGRFTVEVTLQLVSEINNLNFVYPPIVNRIGRITLSAMATSQIYYTYSATGTPEQPTSANWTLYNSEMNLAYGNYMIVAVENGVMSAVISEEFREQETVTISDPVKPLKPVISIENKLIVIEAEPGAEIFYTENQYGLSQTPNQKNWTRYIDPLPAKSSNYKAIARKNYKNSDVAELTRSEIDSYLISTAKNEAVTAAVYTAASLANTAKSEAISAAETKLSEMVGASPETLNTLNELAIALGNDPNFATTTAAEIGKKIDTTTAISNIETAKSEAITAAGADATTKADAAKTAAETTAANLATTAKNDAITAAGTAADAKVKTVADVVNHATTGLATKAVNTEFQTVKSAVNHASTGLATKASNTEFQTVKSAVNHATTGLATKASNTEFQTVKSAVNHATTGLATKISTVDATTAISTAKTEAITAAGTDATAKADAAKNAAEATAATLAGNAKSEAITAANETTAIVAARVDEVEQTTKENSESISNTYQKVTGLEKAVVFGQNKIVFGNQDWIDYVVNSAKSNFYYQAAYYGVVVKGEQTFCINAIMAIEPGSSYKVSVRARSLDGNTTIYAGVDTLNANKLTISTDQASPYNYGTANRAAVSGDSVTYTGYFSGYNAPAEGNKNKFDGGGCFFRVALCCNKGQATNFRTLIESVEIEKISVSRAVDIVEDDSRNFVSLAERNQISDTYNRLVALEEQSLMHMSMLECLSQKLVDAHIGSGTCIETKG